MEAMGGGEKCIDSISSSKVSQHDVVIDWA